MNKKIFGIFVITLLIATASPAVGMLGDNNTSEKTSSMLYTIQNLPTDYVYLADACGWDLSFRGSRVNSDFYECYFHIPVAFEEQVPFYLDIRSVPSDALINYKIVNLTPPNLLVCATCIGGVDIEINWTCYVFVKGKSYSDLPSSAPFPSPDDLPEETKQFLLPTDSCQSNTDVVISKASEFKNQSEGNLMEYTDLIMHWIGDTFPYQGYGDAYWCIENQEGTCTGCAHSAVALYRAVGVPARTLLSMPSWGWVGFDCHWIMEFYLLDYGWVRCDPITATIGDEPEDDIIPMACYPQDEFCLLTDYPGMDGYWHTSDPALSRWPYVGWGGCHGGHLHVGFITTQDKIENAYELSNAVWLEFIKCVGRTVTDEQNSALEKAILYQKSAKESLNAEDIDGFISALQNALSEYQKIKLGPEVTVFFDDFDGEDKGWEHGGVNDEWEWGTPSYGPNETHSGTKCWGVDLDNTYENNAKCWLKSPPFDLSDLSSATLTFWVWSLSVSTNLYSLDHTAVYISTDNGVTLEPISSYMYGGYTSYQVGGWTMWPLDISRYVGNSSVVIYFEFESDYIYDNAGVYIDDVEVTGILPESDLSFEITGGFGVNVIINNTGETDAEDVAWEIHVEGGILGLINKTANDTIDIPAGESETVSTGLFLGLGGIDITATVDDGEKTATGMQIIILTLVK